MHCANDFDNGLSNIFADLPLCGFARAPKIRLKLLRDGSSFTPALKDGDDPGCVAQSQSQQRRGCGLNCCTTMRRGGCAALLVHTGGGGGGGGC